MTTTLQTREEYLTYRATWRATYKQLSLDIREMKQARVRHFRSGNFDLGAMAMHELHPQRRKAHEMMDDLGEHKEQARVTYTKNKDENRDENNDVEKTHEHAA